MDRLPPQRHIVQVSPQWLVLLFGPLLWAVYHLAAWALVEMGCLGGWLTGTILGWPAASVVVVALTVVALVAGLIASWRAIARWRRQPRADTDTSLSRVDDRDRFMLLGAVLLTPLFTFLLFLNGLPALVLPPCGY